MRSSQRIEAEVYEGRHQCAWDDFVDGAKNAHFFFRRGYMEYHADRFADASLMFRSGSRLVAVLPANLSGDTAWSHQGLTYGGLLTNEHMSGELMLHVFDAMTEALRALGARHLVYKCVPHIYFRQPAEEDRYALFRHGARLLRRELSSVLELESGRSHYSKGKRANLAKARRAGIRVSPISDFVSVSSMIDEVLHERHGRRAAHTSAELALLAARFPAHIIAYGAYIDDQMLAAVVLFVNRYVIHTQYMANTPAGRDVGALDLLVDHVIGSRTLGARYLSFGISTENDGHDLNEGLLHSKEAFGARAVVHDTYEVAL